MKIVVRIVQGPASNSRFTVDENERCVVGRSPAANHVIQDDALLSRKHFAIDWDGSAPTLTDLGSANGTFIDRQQLEPGKPIRLKDGQKFIAGRTSVFVVEVLAAGEEPIRTPSPSQRGRNNPLGSSILEPKSDSDKPDSSEFMPHQEEVVEADEGNAGGPFSRSITRDLMQPQNADPRSNLLQNPVKSPLVNRSDSDLMPRKTESKRPKEPRQPVAEERLGWDPESSRADTGSISHPSYFGGSDLPPLPPLPGEEPAEGHTDEASTANPDESRSAPVLQESPSARAIEPGAEPSNPLSDQGAEAPTASGEIIEDDDIEEDCDTSTPYVQGSIFAPGAIPTDMGQQSSPLSDPTSSENVSPSPRHDSIGIPGAIPHDPSPKHRPLVEVEADTSSTESTAFSMQELENGVFIYKGASDSDPATIRSLLANQFESLYCAHLFRAAVEESESEPAASKPAENDLPEDSPFASIDADSPESHDEVAPPKKKVGIPLFDWLTDELAWQNPILLTEDQFQYELGDFWEKDALVCLFGTSEKQLIEHVQDLVRTNIVSGKKGEAIFGCCWPSVLGSAVESMTAAKIDLIFRGGVAAILIEDPEQQSAWVVASKTDITSLLKN